MSWSHTLTLGLVAGLLTLGAAPAKADLQDDIDQVVFILEGMEDDEIPSAVLKDAHGFAVLNNVKIAGGLGASGGRGIVVARTPGGWSPPVGIGTGSISFGLQIGLDVTQLVFLLDSPKSVEALAKGNPVAGLDAGASFLRWGRALTGAIAPSSAVWGGGDSAGLFAGISGSAGFIAVMEKDNAAFYGKSVPAMSILRGEVEAPAGAARLMELLAKY